MGIGTRMLEQVMWLYAGVTVCAISATWTSFLLVCAARGGEFGTVAFVAFLVGEVVELDHRLRMPIVPLIPPTDRIHLKVSVGNEASTMDALPPFMRFSALILRVK